LVHELSQANCAEYLDRRGIQASRVQLLEGGVSSTTLLVWHNGCCLVLKQSLPRLRVATEWIADRRRILREAEALKFCTGILPPGAAPQLLWADADNLIIAMTFLDGPSWKQQLLSGSVCESVAYQAGVIAGSLAGGKVGTHSFDDRTMFHQLRTSPYYRHVLERHLDLRPHLTHLIERLETLTTGFVHGDFSPKNMVVTGAGPALIDYECSHHGDASFDGAFCLNHLVLKAVHMPQHSDHLAAAAAAYWDGLRSRHRDPEYERGVLLHLGALMLARVDGKSPAEYLTGEEANTVRRAARAFLSEPPSGIAEIFTRIRQF
jgi:tRNA A-37 threonylcarbamoyl transferase component Bud32